MGKTAFPLGMNAYQALEDLMESRENNGS